MQKEFKVRVHTCVVCVRVCGHRLCPFRTEARGERNKGLPWCGLAQASCILRTSAPFPWLWGSEDSGQGGDRARGRRAGTPCKQG